MPALVIAELESRPCLQLEALCVALYVLKPTSAVHARAPIAGSPWLRAEWIFMGMCIAQVSWCDCCSAFRSECECLARAFQLCTRCVLDLHRACSRHASSVHWVCIYVYVYALWSDGCPKKGIVFSEPPAVEGMNSHRPRTPNIQCWANRFYFCIVIGASINIHSTLYSGARGTKGALKKTIPFFGHPCLIKTLLYQTQECWPLGFWVHILSHRCYTE